MQDVNGMHMEQLFDARLCLAPIPGFGTATDVYGAKHGLELSVCLGKYPIITKIYTVTFVCSNYSSGVNNCNMKIKIKSDRRGALNTLRLYRMNLNLF